jgi:hypothetical protein
MEIAALGDEDPKALRGLAKRLLELASTGDQSLAAIKEVADRLDGKPAQALEHSGDMTLRHEDALKELDDPDGEADTEASEG